MTHEHKFRFEHLAKIIKTDTQENDDKSISIIREHDDGVIYTIIMFNDGRIEYGCNKPTVETVGEDKSGNEIKVIRVEKN